jgi:predicted glycogen debranching enzyme
MTVRKGHCDWGREICGDLSVAERREWLCTNGLGGYASGTVAGLPTRRHHGLLIAALDPPRARTLLVAKLEETVGYDGGLYALSANRWADGAVDPPGFRLIERFRFDGTTPVWTYAVADALIEKRVWMERGANTTYVTYGLVRGGGPASLELSVLVNYRDHHALTRGGDWRMAVDPVPGGLRVLAFDGARPFTVQARDGDVIPAHVWYRSVYLAREAARGLDATEDLLHAGSIRATLAPGESITVVLSAEAEPSLDGNAAWQRRQRHEADLIARWEAAQPLAREAPAWVAQLVLAAEQFVVEYEGAPSLLAGYPWFDEWGRDTMLSLPGIALVTGRTDLAKRVLSRWARAVSEGMLPNRFGPTGAAEYNTVDAALWFVEAVRATHAVTKDAAFVNDLFPAVEQILSRYRDGTRFGIAMDPLDGLISAGAAGVQLTWMDAKVGDHVITPRAGKPVEINALWYNALRAAALLAQTLRRPHERWAALADRARAGFDRFWNAESGHCYDVIDGPDGPDASLRPNQLLAVSLPESPLGLERQRSVVDICSRRLLTSFGLRTLDPGDPHYRGRYSGAQAERDACYHQGTVWPWLLGPFVLAHLRVHRDPETALGFLEPMAHHVEQYGIGTIAEIFDGDAPHTPCGCIAQAWSVGEVLRAWHETLAARRQ